MNPKTLFKTRSGNWSDPNMALICPQRVTKPIAINTDRIFFTALAGICIGAAIIAYAKPVQDIPPRHQVVMVQPRDTIWSIEAKEYDDRANVRATVDAIMQTNGIHDAGTLYVGQVLDLPVVRE